VTEGTKQSRPPRPNVQDLDNVTKRIGGVQWGDGERASVKRGGGGDILW